MYQHVAKPKSVGVVGPVSLVRAMPSETVSVLINLFWWKRSRIHPWLQEIREHLDPWEINFILSEIVPKRHEVVVQKISENTAKMAIFAGGIERRLTEESPNRRDYFHTSEEGWTVVFCCGCRAKERRK